MTTNVKEPKKYMVFLILIWIALIAGIVLVIFGIIQNNSWWTVGIILILLSVRSRSQLEIYMPVHQ
ncbi:hypothetical protein LCGC14_0175610 [marine sediment metagenome]|uniref:Uncharacterized protein n=1 Tax=marine sediment metagenome TaxID=412755 RepID=A0A0F9V7J7_9ZZZZ